MSESNDVPDIWGQIEAVRERLRREVTSILSEKQKTPIGINELQDRMALYMRRKLDEDMALTDLPPVAEFHSPGQPIEKITLPETFREEADRLQLELMTGDNYDDNFHRAITELVHQNILKTSEISEENAQMIVKAFMIMQIKLFQILSARYNGNYVLEQQLCPENNFNCIRNMHNNIQLHKDDDHILLNELINRYIDIKLKDGKISKETVSDHINRISALQVIIGNKPINKYDRSDMRSFRDILATLPRTWRKEYNNSKINIQDIIKNSKDVKKLSTKTINVHVEAVSTMFSWAVNEGLLQSNPAKELSIKDNQPDIDKRQPFSIDDIQLLFFAGDYTYDHFAKPSYYWVPLISLYTGMRLEEICQLHTEDIYREEGIYIIDVRRESKDGLNDKILKTNNAIRKIPIHSHLIELGFVDYVRKLKSNNEIRVFSELNKTARSPKYGKQVGKQFAAWVAKKGISGAKTFHSLRHSFSDFFKKRNLHTDMFRQVFGHEKSQLAARQYGSRFTPKEIYDNLISLIDYSTQKN